MITEIRLVSNDGGSSAAFWSVIFNRPAEDLGGGRWRVTPATGPAIVITTASVAETISRYVDLTVTVDHAAADRLRELGRYEVALDGTQAVDLNGCDNTVYLRPRGWDGASDVAWEEPSDEEKKRIRESTASPLRLSLVVLYIPPPTLDRAAAFYGAILDVEPVRKQNDAQPEYYVISSYATGLTIEVHPAVSRPATVTRLEFRGPHVRQAIQRLADEAYALPEPHTSGGWWCSDPAGNTVVLMGSASYDRLTEPMGLRFVELTAEEATANRRRAQELIGKPLPVSEYERGLYLAEGKPVPED
ncbi:VOC family protein [Mycobacterium sp. 155]|uniref:VOC family protein n=1 Tax=Mycobacterium sp. 155 TaxID=1157943 RepID=UPI000369E9D6|nr:hypothetical protein [Mycobacterium sp. 155]